MTDTTLGLAQKFADLNGALDAGAKADQHRRHPVVDRTSEVRDG
jgi:hypothetical protein